ncbi:MAG: M23 family metallopeptidase, partial [Flavobacteriaceae bacterium]|nr:M23 family metallopeptidase [Flavobacteriaceae bacterium]
MTNNIKSSLGIALLFLSFFISAQEATPPLDIPLLLSGNFGELRGSHFHAGLDIKTQGLQGFPVKSILAGSIRRIRVTVTGYGKALYIDHATGTTSVYA